MKKHWYLWSLIILLSFQCQDEEPPPVVNLEQELRLAAGEMAVVSHTDDQNQNRGFKLTVNSIQDNRCPANVMCVRMGEALTTLTVMTFSDQNPVTLNMCQGEDCKFTNNTFNDFAEVGVDGVIYRIAFKNVEPYPGTVDPNDPTQIQKVVLEITVP